MLASFLKKAGKWPISRRGLDSLEASDDCCNRLAYSQRVKRGLDHLELLDDDSIQPHVQSADRGFNQLDVPDILLHRGFDQIIQTSAEHLWLKPPNSRQRS